MKERNEKSYHDSSDSEKENNHSTLETLLSFSVSLKKMTQQGKKYSYVFFCVLNRFFHSNFCQGNQKKRERHLSPFLLPLHQEKSKPRIGI